MAARDAASERRGTMRAIATEIPRIAGPVLGKRGFAEAQLIAQWPAIIGEAIGALVSPEKLSFSRGERRDGTLHVRVAPAVATEIQHREPVLIERINAFFGYRAVARLALKQGPALRPDPPPPRPRALHGNERQQLDRRLADIEDPELRAALQRLGEAVLGDERK
ncbi:MAG TPA: DciA family protein [Stellaceae bacterium]|nr:DciA family protein [Stellaceae bacterium]